LAAQFEENMSSKPKQERVKRQDATRKEQGAHARPGKNVTADNESRPGVHNGKAIPAPTRSVDLTDEVTDLSPRGK
jgi:hypothetical protein